MDQLKLQKLISAKKNNCKLKLWNIVLIKNPLVVVLLQSKLGNVSQNFYTFHFT